MKTVVKRLWSDEEGQGMVEYALIIAGVSLVLLAAFGGLKPALEAVVTKIETALGVAAGS